MSHFSRVMTYGLISWMVPFLVSMAFAGRGGYIQGDYAVFRTTMFIASTFTTAVLLAAHFRHITRKYLREGILVGAVWLEINLSLDFMIVVPRSGLGMMTYLTQVGVDYVGIPVLAVLVGYFLWECEQPPLRLRRQQRTGKSPKVAPETRPLAEPVPATLVAEKVAGKMEKPGHALSAPPKMEKPGNAVAALPTPQVQPRLFAPSPPVAQPSPAPARKPEIATFPAKPAIESRVQPPEQPSTTVPNRQLPTPPDMKLPMISEQTRLMVQSYLTFAQKLADLNQQKPAQPRKSPARYSNLP